MTRNARVWPFIRVAFGPLNAPPTGMRQLSRFAVGRGEPSLADGLDDARLARLWPTPHDTEDTRKKLHRSAL
jgi:hypothetical protein